MKLEDLYNDWQFRPINGGENKTPRDQASGTAAVDFLPNDYQVEVKNRAVDDKVVVQSTVDDDTLGTFKKDTAFKYYSTLIGQYSTTAQTYKAPQVSNSNTFTDASEWTNSPGVLFSTNS